VKTYIFETILIIGIVCCIQLLHQIVTVQSASYNTVNFQGKLIIKSDGTNINTTSTPCILAGSSNDTCDFNVRYYNSAIGGTLFASEEFLNIEVGDYNGIFNLTLGNGTFSAGLESTFTNIFINNIDVYFEVQFDPNGSGYSETFTQPSGSRMEFKAVPYSLNSSNLIGGLDKAYTNDTDKVLNINNALGLELISSNVSGNLTFDLTSTSDIIFQDSNSTFLTITDSGGFDYLLDSTDNPSFILTNEGTGSFTVNDAIADTTPFTIDSSGNVGVGLTSLVNKFTVVNSTGTSSNSAASLVYSHLSDATAISGSALDLTLTPSGNSTDSITGININNITNSGSTETAINIGSGFDKDIKLNNSNSNIEIANNSQLNITDGTNNLLQAKDLNTQFGLALNSGAFIDRNSSLQEEFNKFRSTITADTTGANGTGIGDGGGWGSYEAPNCDIGSLADNINGVVRLLSNTTNADCMIMIDQAINNPHSIANANSLPIVLMKLRPSATSATVKTFAGISDATDGSDVIPTNFIGFSNNSGTTWSGQTVSSGTASTLTCTGQTISTTQFALLLIEVRTATDIRFFVDNNVSDGITFFECGSITTNIPTINLTPQINLAISAGGAGNFLDIDFFRLWQDDNEDSSTQAPESVPAVSLDEPIYYSSEEEVEIKNEGLEDTTINTNAPLITPEQNYSDDKNEIDLEGENEILEGNKTENTFNLNNLISHNDSVLHLSQSSSFNKLQVNFQEILLASNIFIDGLIQVNGSLNVKEDLSVNGNLNISSNSSGVVILPSGSVMISVNFAKISIDTPLIFANLIGDNIVNYSITNITTQGFSIIIREPVEKDLKFNWFKIH
jgi:hypothetical protein